MENKENRCGCDCYIVVGIFSIIILLIAANSEDVISWTEKRQGMAGWLQFFGAVVAIFGAAWISNINFKKQIDHAVSQQRREASIDAISIISSLTSSVDALKEFKKFHSDEYLFTKGDIALALMDVLTKVKIPDNKFAIKMIHVDADCAKALAIANEVLVQLKPHVARCINSRSHFLKGRRHEMIELTDMLFENLILSRELIEEFLKSEGMFLYSGNK